MDLWVFQTKNKLTKCIYTRESSGYKVMATEAPIAHSVRVSNLYQTTENVSVAAFQPHGLNFARLPAGVG